MTLDTTSQLLKEYTNRNWSRRWLNLSSVVRMWNLDSFKSNEGQVDGSGSLVPAEDAKDIMDGEEKQWRSISRGRGTSYITEKYTSTAACFPGACIEKTESGEFGGDGKDRREESKGTSETEASGQPVWFIEGQSKRNTAHQSFRGQRALAVHGQRDNSFVKVKWKLWPLSSGHGVFSTWTLLQSRQSQHKEIKSSHVKPDPIGQSDACLQTRYPDFWGQLFQG